MIRAGIGSVAALAYFKSVKGRGAFIQTEGAAGLEMSNPPIATSIDVAILDPLQDPDWDDLVVSHPECNVFHSAAWAKVLVKTYAHKPFYLYFSRQFQAVALVPIMEIRSVFTGRRGVCLPFSDLCAPLIFDPSESARVIDKLSELARERNWKYFEIRGGKGTLPAGATPATRFRGHKLSLSDTSEELFARCASPVRRAIRKAEKSGVDVQVTKTRDAILEFYRLHVRTRRRHGLPPQPLSFFHNIYEEIIKAGQGFVVLARRGSRCFAAAVFFQFGKNAVYKFGASDEAFQEFRGNNLVMWDAIKFLRLDGAKMLHFGRTSLDNDGLRRFKMGWGAVEEEIEYFKFDFGARIWQFSNRNDSGFYNNIFRRLPLVFNRLAGAVIYPHLD